jgi:hypothetical protein
VLRLCLLSLRKKLDKQFPGCNVKKDSDSTELNKQEVTEFGYNIAKVLRTGTFYNKAEHIINKS